MTKLALSAFLLLISCWLAGWLAGWRAGCWLAAAGRLVEGRK
jgi:hypothetical protein